MSLPVLRPSLHVLLRDRRSDVVVTGSLTGCVLREAHMTHYFKFKIPPLAARASELI